MIMNPIHAKLTQSSLLIPEKFFDIFEEKTTEISREEYFCTLLKRYKELVLSGLYPKSEKPKTAYQDKDQNLIKVNFRPSNDDWIELGILAAWLGISRTALFTWFLTLDIASWDKILSEKFFDNGVPPNITVVRVGSYIARRKTVRADRHIRYKQRL